MTSNSTELLHPLCSALVMLHLPQHKSRGCAGRSAAKGHKGYLGAAASVPWGKADTAGILQPGEGANLSVNKYLKGRCKEGGVRGFQGCPVAGPEAQSVPGDFCLSIRKCFAVRVTEHWPRLPREVVYELPCLAILRSILDMVLHSQLELALLSGMLEQMISRGP